MKIVVIEDEVLIANDLVDILHRIAPSVEIVAQIGSVQEGISFFNENPIVDLIFSDIHLGDGLSFEIFKEVKSIAPIIFCTAYDSYAIDAFKVNGIDYILKPFSEKNIQEALAGYQRLKDTFQQAAPTLEKTMDEISQNSQSHATILVFHRDKIIPLAVSEIAFAYIRNDAIYLKTFDEKSYLINKSLDELDQLLGANFYRTNRQFIVNRSAVKDVTTIVNRKYAVNLTIPFPEQITVSKEKMTSFLKWLRQE